jgi:aspartate/methionine/tyrosine aminotransferase
MPSPPVSSSASAIRASVFADLAPRIEAHARRGGELVALHIGDTHLAPPREALFEAGDASHYRYGAVTGVPELREAVAAALLSRGWGPSAIDPSRDVLLGCGATHALFCAARAVLEPGDEVLVAAPYWPLTVGILRAAGAVPVEVPLTSRLYREPGLDAGEPFRAAVGPRTRAIYLITPNNPDGKVLSRAQLAQIAKVAREHDLWVFADEVYADYVYGGEGHASIARLDGMAERTLSAYSFSKSHALAGARVGYVVGPAAAIACAQRVSTHTVFNVPVVAQRAAVRALAGGAAWVDAARREYVAARDAAAEALRGARVSFSLAEGGSYLFVDFAEMLGGRSLTALLERAIDEGVLLAPGDAFGAGYERCARLCFTAVPRERLLDGVRRLRAAIDAFG